MRIQVAMKQFGAKRPLAEKDFTIPPVATTRELIDALVRDEVAKHNAKPDESQALLTPLCSGDIEAQAVSGKVGFNRRYGERQDPDAAVATAEQAYADGLFKIFIGDEEAGALTAPLTLHDGARLTFIRLMMLSGI